MKNRENKSLEEREEVFASLADFPAARKPTPFLGGEVTGIQAWKKKAKSWSFGKWMFLEQTNKIKNPPKLHLGKQLWSESSPHSICGVSDANAAPEQMEIDKNVRSYLGERWEKFLPKPLRVLLYTCPPQLGSGISSVCIVSHSISAGCNVRSYPDSQAKPLEILSLSRLHLLGYGDKDYVQTTFPAAPTGFWLESKLGGFNSQQLTC